MNLFTDVKTLIDEPGTGVFWTDSQVYDAINDAQLELYASTKWAVSTATLTATASAAFITLPSTIMIPQYFVGSGGKYFPTSHARLEEWSRTWKSEGVGYPKHLVLWDASTLRPFPRPDTTYTYILTGVAWPTQIEAGTLDITAPARLKGAITYRAAASLLEATLPDLSDVMHRESLQEEEQFKQTLRNYQPHNTKRMRPGTAFTLAQAGGVLTGKRLD